MLSNIIWRIHMGWGLQKIDDDINVDCGQWTTARGQIKSNKPIDNNLSLPQLAGSLHEYLRFICDDQLHDINSHVHKCTMKLLLIFYHISSSFQQIPWPMLIELVHNLAKHVVSDNSKTEQFTIRFVFRGIKLSTIYGASMKQCTLNR